MNIEQISKEVNLLASFLNIEPNEIHLIHSTAYATPKGIFTVLSDREYKLYQWVVIRNVFVEGNTHVINGVDAMDYLTPGGQRRFETVYGKFPNLVSFDDVNKEAFVAAVLNTVDDGVFANCTPVDGYWIIPIHQRKCDNEPLAASMQ